MKDYKHPLDCNALNAVKKTPFFPEVKKKMMDLHSVKLSVIAMCGSNYHVTKASCPSLYSPIAEVARTLDLNVMPDFYIEQNYYINAYTIDNGQMTYTVLSSGCVDHLSDKEILFIIGHEIGHIESGHVLYHIMYDYIQELIKGFSSNELAAELPLALRYWNIMSDFTADRVGLLACQDLEQALNVIMKMSGLPMKYYNDASLESFIEQAREFNDRYSGFFETVVRNLTILGAEHSWTVVRAAELIKWVESGGYDKILKETKVKICARDGSRLPIDAIFCPYCGCTEFIDWDEL